MKNVSFTINNANFALACNPEEEKYILKLVAEIDERAKQAYSKSTPINDRQMLLMVALSILDELKEKEKKIQNLETEINTNIPTSLQNIATRIEKLASDTDN